MRKQIVIANKITILNRFMFLSSHRNIAWLAIITRKTIKFERLKAVGGGGGAAEMNSNDIYRVCVSLFSQTQGILALLHFFPYLILNFDNLFDYFSDFRYESDEIFVFGVGFFFFRQISTF